MTEALVTPALGFSYQVVLDKDARRTIVFQTHLTVECERGQIDQQLDKMRDAADRQIAFHDMQEAEVFMADHANRLKALREQMELLVEVERVKWEGEGIRFGPWSEEALSATEKQALNNIKVSISRYEEGYKKYSEQYERCKGVLSGARANGAANSNVSMPDS